MRKQYVMLFASGWSKRFWANSERSAKAKTTKELTHGGGSATLYEVIPETPERQEELYPVACRCFWSNFRTFGWNNWEMLNK